MSLKNVFDSVAFKLGVIGVLILLLLIPLQMIKGLIWEREQTRNEVVAEIGSSWANQQVFSGPVITVPYNQYFKDDDKIKHSIGYAHFLPKDLNIAGQINPEMRYRGIYKVIVYNSELKVSGSFEPVTFDAWKINPEDILWDEAFLSLGISDMRGIGKELNIKLGADAYSVDPGIRSFDVLENGVSTAIKLYNDNKEIPFSFDLSLRGSQYLGFIPMGKTSQINLKSDWTTPSFNGNFLPAHREVTDEGFTADWTVLHLNRNFPQAWMGPKYNVDKAQFGVDLLLPVDRYLKTERAVKYGLMFIVLTFMVFFFTEVMYKKRIHPIQYLLIGISLLIFYTLLLSLSEHMSFGAAYLIAAVAIISLIGFYVKAALNNSRVMIFTVGILFVLYAFLYIILQMEQYALLMGSVGIFVVMAVIMYLSRKVDWYEPLSTKKDE